MSVSPGVKKWLGHPLTEQEQSELDAMDGIDADFDEFDLASVSPEARAWLLQPPSLEGER